MPRLKISRRWMVAAIAVGALVVSAVIFVVRPDDGDILRSAAIAGGDYLVRQQKPDGSFVYQYDPIARSELPTYNIVRHAGTAYSLFELYGATSDAKYFEAGERALTFLLAKVEQCPTEGSCIEDLGEVSVGGNALAVLAITEHARVGGGTRHLETAARLAEFLLSLQDESGEFRTHIFRNGIASDFRSAYYPGEAIFALARLHAATGEEKWIESAERAARWVIETRDGDVSDSKLNHDHWLLYGINELHAYNPDAFYVAHAKRLADAIIASQHAGLEGAIAEWNGGYYNPPRSTPTATRTEGLSAAHTMFLRAGESEYALRALAAIREGIDFQQRTQLTEEKARRLDADRAAIGGFHGSLHSYEIRIDYVQHNISAILGYLRAVSDTAE